jgi:hypothetical protein
MKLLLPIFIRKLRRDAPASLVRIKTALEEHSSG